MLLDQRTVSCLYAAAKNYWLKKRSWLLDSMTVVSSYTNEIEYEGSVKVGSDLMLEQLKYPNLTEGCVARVNKAFIGIVKEVVEGSITFCVLSKYGEPCFHMLDVMPYNSGEAAKYFGNVAVTKTNWGDTTVGRFLCNMVILQYPFNWEVFEFKNFRWKPDDIVRMVKDELLAKRITVQEYEKFFNYLYFIGHLTELSNPSMTLKSLQTNPKVPELKRKFVEEHKDEMHDPLVVQKLEQMLIAADKEYLGDDPSVTFFNGLGSKAFDVQRKKMFLTVGGIPAFGTESGEMDFIYNSLMEGWTIPALPSIANEIRKGSYERGVETAKGGAETKLVLRAFQDTTISEDDCGTKRTIAVDCSQFDGKCYIGRTIRVGQNDIIVTKENLDKYVTGKVIHLYSPLTCETKHNFCYKCCGLKAKELGAKQLGIQTIKLTSKFMSISMKNMHGTALSVQDNKLEDILL